MNTKPRVMVVDDDRDYCRLVEAQLADHEMDVLSCEDAIQAIERLRQVDVDVVVTDLCMDGMDGLELCEWVRLNRPSTPTVLVTGFGNMTSAIRAMRAGAFDMLTKPTDGETLPSTVTRAVLQRQVLSPPKRLVDVSESVQLDALGRSRAMREVWDLVARVCKTNATVMIWGETGTGKELLARAIHDSSPRASAPFVVVNCAALPATLLESELFGHVKGAFTDAHESRRGLLQEANGGSLFLDEIGDMPPVVQVKLLRALQERRVRAVGDNEEHPFDTRIIAATHRDLEKEVEAGRFRKDLYYRINVVPIVVPPLRQRGDDLLYLANQFVRRHAAKVGRTMIGLDAEAAAAVTRYPWPGNVRELENAMARAVVLADSRPVRLRDLPKKVRTSTASPPPPMDADPTRLIPLDELEKQHIQRVLKRLRGNKTLAAKTLGVDRRTIYRKLQRLNDG